MALEIITKVRQALRRREPLKQSDILALCAAADQLWRQVAIRQPSLANREHRRDYMRHYMRSWRREKRAGKLSDL